LEEVVRPFNVSSKALALHLRSLVWWPVNQTAMAIRSVGRQVEMQQSLDHLRRVLLSPSRPVGYLLADPILVALNLLPSRRNRSAQVAPAVAEAEAP
jgi:hypothetical protein